MSSKNHLLNIFSEIVADHFITDEKWSLTYKVFFAEWQFALSYWYISFFISPLFIGKVQAVL